MEVTPRLRERFCKDCNIPINIFHEPYFTDRITLYDKFYSTVDKWNLFVEEFQKYRNEQDYFEEYNRVKDNAINFIKSTDAYQRFNEEDMNQYAIKNKGFPGKDIYHPDNDGKTFISIDMKKANFSALRFYDASIFDHKETWEEFVKKFTDNKHVINSKYIRQVILGNCNPKKHITYEKYLMDMILDNLLEMVPLKRIVFFSNDEIVIDISDMSIHDKFFILSQVKNALSHIMIPLKIELFRLYKISGINGYYKKILAFNRTEIELKCVDYYMMPFVMRKLQGEEVKESDKVFYHEGLLAKFIETPRIDI